METVNRYTRYVFADQRSIIDIWHGSKYGSAASLLKFFLLLCFYIFIKEHINIFFLVSKCRAAILLTYRKSKMSYEIFHWFPDHLSQINYDLSFEVLRKSKRRKKIKWLNKTDVVCLTQTSLNTYDVHLCFGDCPAWLFL